MNDNANESDVIKLNVGGITYITTRTTLCQPGSWFETMFSGKMKPGLQIDGSYFIDRDGPMFLHVLNYLRNLDRWLPPAETDILSRLVNEAEYFCLQGMLDKIKKAIPIKHYTFEVYIKHDEGGRIKCVLSRNAPTLVEDYLDTITITKESIDINPPKLGIVYQLINRIDDQYELYCQYTTGEWMTLIFKINPKHIALTRIKSHLGMFNQTK